MRAIVIATGDSPDMGLLNDTCPTPMLPLVNYPVIQHLVELLTNQGVLIFDFILSHLPEDIERFLGDGARWGTTFRYHLARDPTRPYGRLPGIVQGLPGEHILLVHADRLTDARVVDTRPTPARPEPILYCHQPERVDATEPDPVWSGWAWLHSHHLMEIENTWDRYSLEARLLTQARKEGTIVEIPLPLAFDSYEDLLEAHRMILGKQLTGFMLRAREIEEGIWLSHNVTLHPTARLTRPVYVGANCRIGLGVHLGPCTVVGDDCVLDSHCAIKDSVVFPGSYVGEALELDQMLVDRTNLINVALNAAVPVVDDFILGNLSGPGLADNLTGLFSRGTAALLLLALSPLLLLLMACLKLIRKGPLFHHREMVRLPASPHEYLWRTYRLFSFSAHRQQPAGEGQAYTALHLENPFLSVLPALLNIARGELRFVGVPPRTAEEIQTLPREWRTLYLKAKAGIISETFVNFGSSPSEDEQYTAEAFYSAQSGFKQDFTLLMRYIRGRFTFRKKS